MYSTEEYLKKHGLTSDDLITIYEAPSEDSNEGLDFIAQSPFLSSFMRRNSKEWKDYYHQQIALGKQKKAMQRMSQTAAYDNMRATVGHAIGISLSSTGSMILSTTVSIDAVLILAGPLVVLGNKGLGFSIGSVYQVSAARTSYTYLGDIKNLSPDTFAGKSASLSGSITIKGVDVGDGLSFGLQDEYGGRLGKSTTIGGSVGPGKSIVGVDGHVKVSKIVYVSR